jgi:hypothetical protein
MEELFSYKKAQNAQKQQMSEEALLRILVPFCGYLVWEDL